MWFVTTGDEEIEGPLDLARVVRLPRRGGTWAGFEGPVEEVGNTVLPVSSAQGRWGLMREELERDLLTQGLINHTCKAGPKPEGYRVTRQCVRRRMTQRDFCFASFW